MNDEPVPSALERWYPALVCKPARFRVVAAGDRKAVGEVAAAWSQLASGEALVLVDRPSGWRRRVLRASRGGDAMRLARELPGVYRLDRWVRLPGTGGSDVLLPAGCEAFVPGLRLLPAGRLRWRVARKVLELLGRAGLSDHLGLDELVVAVKGLAPSAEIPWISQVPGACFGVSLGVPGLLRKVTTLVTDAHGDPHAVLKLSLGEPSVERVRHEADVLARLVEIAPQSTFAPELFDTGCTASGLAWLAQEVLPGERSRDDSEGGHVPFLAGLHWRTGRLIPFEELRMFAEDCERLERIGAEDRDWYAPLAELRDVLRARLVGSDVPCAMAHGDFTPWNLVAFEGRLRAFDWEFSREDAPALYDIVHFHVQTGVLVQRLEPRAILERLAVALDGPNGTGLLQNAGLCPREVDTHAALYVLHVATADEELVRREHPGFAQVQWLREARLGLARVLAQRLREHLPERREAPAA